MQVAMDLGKDCDIIAIQEPWIGRNERTIDQTEYTQTIGQNGYEILFSKSEKKRKTRVMWMVRKDRGLRYSIRNDIWKEWDASVMDIEGERGGIRNVNIYNQQHDQEGGWCTNRIPTGIARQQTTLILADFNAHNNLWNSAISNGIRDNPLLEAMDREGLTLINEKDRIHFDNGRSRSILDLAWITHKDWDGTKWELRTENESRSDHAGIRIHVGIHQEMCSNPMETRWKVQESDWDKVKGKCEEKKRTRATEWANNIQQQQWDNLADMLTEIIRQGVEAGTPKARQCWRSKKWFDTEVKEKRKGLARAKRWEKGGGQVQGREEWKKERNEYVRLIRKK